jgi:Zn ribbon nucleic-acid-binding protein
MSDLPCPAAEAASGLFDFNTMSDVIDALKRLERIGSETSKTTQKLIDAAGEVASLIVKQYEPIADGEVIKVASEEKWVESDGELEYDKNPWTDYHISDRQLQLNSGGGRQMAVDSCRAAALKFSEDIAKGLLDHIIRDIEGRCEGSMKALSILEGAVDKIKQNPDLTVLCPVCEAGAQITHEAERASNQVKCVNCGHFKIPDNIIRELQQEDRHPMEQRWRLSKAIRLAFDRGGSVELQTIQDVMHLMAELDQTEAKQRKAR